MFPTNIHSWSTWKQCEKFLASAGPGPTLQLDQANRTSMLLGWTLGDFLDDFSTCVACILKFYPYLAIHLFRGRPLTFGAKYFLNAEEGSIATWHRSRVVDDSWPTCRSVNIAWISITAGAKRHRRRVGAPRNGGCDEKWAPDLVVWNHFLFPLQLGLSSSQVTLVSYFSEGWLNRQGRLYWGWDLYCVLQLHFTGTFQKHRDMAKQTFWIQTTLFSETHAKLWSNLPHVAGEVANLSSHIKSRDVLWVLIGILCPDDFPVDNGDFLCTYCICLVYMKISHSCICWFIPASVYLFQTFFSHRFPCTLTSYFIIIQYYTSKWRFIIYIYILYTLYFIIGCPLSIVIIPFLFARFLF